MKSKKSKNSKEKKGKGRSFYEIFKVTKKGKEKTIKKNVSEDEEKPSKKQISQENRILGMVLVFIGLVILGVLVYFFVSYQMSFFEYRGVEFQKVDEVAPYKTTFPVILANGEIAEYNIYLRNDPRNLDSIEFDGEMNLIDNIVLSSENDFNCEGDGIISVANMAQFYEVLGAKVFKNETLSCSSEDEYTYIELKEGDETKIEQFGWSCYRIHINNCEILKGTERFMVESFVEVNNLIRERKGN